MKCWCKCRRSPYFTVLKQKIIQEKKIFQIFKNRRFKTSSNIPHIFRHARLSGADVESLLKRGKKLSGQKIAHVFHDGWHTGTVMLRNKGRVNRGYWVRELNVCCFLVTVCNRSDILALNLIVDKNGCTI
uniref:Uncharacterized protein n=1 Tax=Guillardia theta TaxID=55529 RepID=A0A7S4K7X2_GUITH